MKEVLTTYHSLIWLVKGFQHRCSVWRIGTLYVYSPSSALLLLAFILPTPACAHHPLSSSYLSLKSLFQVLDYNDLDSSIVGPYYSGYEVPYPSLLSPLTPSFTPLFPLVPLCLSFYSTIPSGTHPCIHLREQCECKSNIKQLPENGMISSKQSISPL